MEQAEKFTKKEKRLALIMGYLSSAVVELEAEQVIGNIRGVSAEGLMFGSLLTGLFLAIQHPEYARWMYGVIEERTKAQGGDIMESKTSAIIQVLMETQPITGDEEEG